MVDRLQVTQEECDKLTELYKRAQNTPVIAMSVQDGLEGNDFASLAWKDVEKYMDELGQKYGYDPKKYAINQVTREIVPYG